MPQAPHAHSSRSASAPGRPVEPYPNRLLPTRIQLPCATANAHEAVRVPVHGNLAVDAQHARQDRRRNLSGQRGQGGGPVLARIDAQRPHEESTSAARAFGTLGERVRIWHRAEASARGSLHAKVITADRRIALLGSANLTDRALYDNVEIGITLRDRRTVSRLTDHFHWLTGPEACYLRRK
ncbi:phospholipase D-like domain-containing protein [Streptomyces nitrosporeus]|uniref:phospholipase D-like domain-containing protein n=1 Tax=Streptomyces nitrosporeus TaxID=28894 RepID=UPI0039A1F35C